MIAARAARGGLLGAPAPTVAVDATCFEARHVSAHYAYRRGGRRAQRRARQPKLTTAVHTASHLIVGARTGRGPAPDHPDFAPVVRQAAAFLERVWAAVADAGFDSEDAHALCRETLGIRRTAIKLNPRRHGRTWPRTPYRRAMRRRFPRALYRRRQQAESVFSRDKRRLGSALTARHWVHQREEMILRVLTHNLMLLHRARRSFQQSRSES